MSALKGYERVEQQLRHGGAVVLSISADQPLGEGVCALHVRALVERLLDYVRETQLPPAAEALEALAAEGRGYLFSPRRCLIRVHTESLFRGVERVELGLIVMAGEEILADRSLSMYWDFSGEFQLMRLPRRHRRVPFFGRRWGEKKEEKQKPDR